jgi:hypothetical protein
MPRSARRYDFYLPLTHNDGRLIADDIFKDVQRRLLAQFGGLTAQQREFPLQGIWHGGTRLYLDLVIIMTVLDFRRQGSTRFIAKLKRDLLRDFDQLEILITEQTLRVH